MLLDLQLLLDYTNSSFDINALYPDVAGKKTMSVLGRALKVDNTFLYYVSDESYEDSRLIKVLSLLLRCGAKATCGPLTAIDLAIAACEHAALELLAKHDPKTARAQPGGN